VGSQADDLAVRLKQFAIRILAFVRTLARDPASETVARQLARSGTGESANYHAARRARSRAEFIAKLGVAAEEADETEHWLEVIRESGLASGGELEGLWAESIEIRAILVSSVTTARRNYKCRNHLRARKTPRS
jgi:four helix bundle protein